MNKAVLKKIRKGIYISTLFLIMYTCGLVGQLYGQYKKPSQSLIDFVTQKEEYTFNRFEKPPEEYLSKLNFMNQIRSIIWLIIALNFSIVLFDHFIGPESSAITILKGITEEVLLKCQNLK